MASSGIRFLTAITVSGCSLLFFAFLRNKFPAIRSCSGETNPQHNKRISSAPKSLVKKKVRFSEDVGEPSGNSAEYRRRRGQKWKREATREKTVEDLAANKSALYNGISRYRSQRAAFIIYA